MKTRAHAAVKALGAAIVVAAAFWAAAPVRAGEVVDASATTLGQVVSGHPGLTWRAALRTFLMNVHGGADGVIEAEGPAEIRRFEVKGDASALASIRLMGLAARDVVEGGRKRLIVLANLDPAGA